MSYRMKIEPRMSDSTNNKDESIRHLSKLDSFLVLAFELIRSKARVLGLKPRGHEFELCPMQIVFDGRRSNLDLIPHFDKLAEIGQIIKLYKKELVTYL